MEYLTPTSQSNLGVKIQDINLAKDLSKQDIASIREMLKDQKHKADEIILDEMNKDELEQLLVSVGLTKGPTNLVDDIHLYQLHRPILHH